MIDEEALLDGACHCGTVRFQVRLSGGLAAARRCNCSICRMRGAVALTARLSDLVLVAGEEALATYRFNTGAAEHHFCRHCGIYTHHRRRSNGQEYGVNAACIAGLSPFDFAEVQVLDGVDHPNDRPDGRSAIAGVLRYEPCRREGD